MHRRIAPAVHVVCVLMVATMIGCQRAGAAARPSQASVDINTRDAHGQTALERAIVQRDINSVRALIRAGADVNTTDLYGRTPLSEAIGEGEVEIVRALARAGADLNAEDRYGWTPIKHAFKDKQYEVLEALIQEGASVDRDQLRKDLNKQNVSGDTLLTRTHDIPSLRALVRLGADPNLRNKSGMTALAYAAFYGDLEKVRALIELGADVNVQDKRGSTPLMLTCQGGHAHVAQALLKAGEDPNAEGPRGWTALMYAAYLNRLETVRVLIPATNVNYSNQDGVSALTLARWACHAEIARALVRAGATTSPTEWRRAPRFGDFPVDHVYKGAPKPVDLHSHPRARTYRTRLRQGARMGPNFAGRYTVVSWGCGSNCESTMIVDAATGEVFDGVGAQRGAQFRLDSNLYIADPAEGDPAYPDDPTSWLPVRYYVWSGQRFKPIYEEPCSVEDKHQVCGCPSLYGPEIQPAER